MKIEYTPNPLDTKVILDEHEQEVFKLKIRLNEFDEMVYGAYFTLTHHDWINSETSKNRTLQDTVDEAVKELDPDYWMIKEAGKPSKMDERVDELFKHYIGELQSFHVGDCTCFAMSCSKCHAESMLGIDTIKGLGKHPGHQIQSVFSRWNPETKKHDRPAVSLDEALEKLRTYDPKPTGDQATWDKVGGFEQHVPRWKAEANSAYEWLLNYRNTHFKD